jgi:hypothetical protein
MIFNKESTHITYDLRYNLVWLENHIDFMKQIKIEISNYVNNILWNNYICLHFLMTSI